MKKICLFFMMATGALASNAEHLTHTYISGPRSNGMQVYPLSFVSLQYDENVFVDEDATIVLSCDGETIREDQVSVTDRKYKSSVGVVYEPALLLPKGKEYVIEVSAGVIHSKANPEITNDAIMYSFGVPETLGVPQPQSGKDGDVVETLKEVIFHLPIETEAAYDFDVTLLREGVPVRNFPAQVQWDWDMTLITVYFKPEYRFEKDVDFAFNVPEGVVFTYRPDIMNEAASWHFTGGCGELAPLSYSSISFDTLEETELLRTEHILFDEKICVVPDAKAILYDVTQSQRLEFPFRDISYDENGSDVSIRFGDYYLNKGHKYELIFPEFTFYSAEGDVRVNKEYRIPLRATDVDCVMTARGIIEAECMAGGIKISSSGNLNINVSDSNGKCHFSGPVENETYIPLEKGVYIVSGGNDSIKIFVK